MKKSVKAKPLRIFSLHIDIHRANEAKRRAEQRLQDKQAHV
ncbi:ATP synthase delta/epsilon chain alpha-helix domain-containing protein, partial [Bacillus sp. SS-TM]